MSKELQQEEKNHRIRLPIYSLGEELWNAISHGIGTALSIAALILCVVKSAHTGSALSVVCSALYGSSLILLYLVSTLYHALGRNGAKRVFRVLDHCTIFVMILGTYLPVLLLAIGGAVGWIFFGIVAAAAILGITLNAIDVERFEKGSLYCYIAMGWIIVLAFKPLYDAVGLHAILWLIAGGVVYTVGAILYHIGAKEKYFHSVWHFFVLGGSICHFFAIYLYVI